MRSTLIVLGGSLALAFAAQAQTPPTDRTFGDSELPEFLKQYDTNQDGVLDEEERQAMKDALQQKREDWIKEWDKDGDGKLSPAEVEAMRAALRARVEQRRTDHFAKIAGEDGKLSLEEFLALPAFADKDPTVPTNIFNMMDTDDDGYVTEDEFLARLRPPTPRLPLFDAVDTDDSGDVTLEEFLAATTAAGMPEQVAREIFARLDKNEDGVLTPPGPDGEYPPPPPPPPPAPPPLPPFGSVDRNMDRKASLDEFLLATRISPPGTLPNPCGMPEPVARALFQQLDRNRDGFLQGMSGPGMPPPEYPQQQQQQPPQPPTFAQCDANGDGFVTETEFVNAWQGAGFRNQNGELGALWANLIHDRDQDKDGKLGPTEYPAPRP